MTTWYVFHSKCVGLRSEDHVLQTERCSVYGFLKIVSKGLGSVSTSTSLFAHTNNRGNFRNQRRWQASLFQFAHNFAGSELGLLRRKPQGSHSGEQQHPNL